MLEGGSRNRVRAFASSAPPYASAMTTYPASAGRLYPPSVVSFSMNTSASSTISTVWTTSSGTSPSRPTGPSSPHPASAAAARTMVVSFLCIRDPSKIRLLRGGRLTTREDERLRQEDGQRPDLASVTGSKGYDLQRGRELGQRLAAESARRDRLRRPGHQDEPPEPPLARRDRGAERGALRAERHGVRRVLDVATRVDRARLGLQRGPDPESRVRSIRPAPRLARDALEVVRRRGRPDPRLRGGRRRPPRAVGARIVSPHDSPRSPSMRGSAGERPVRIS